MAAGDPGSPARYYSSTAIETALSGAIGAQAQGAANTSFIVGSVSGFPTSYPYTLIVDPDTSKEEVLTVFAGSGTTLSVYRGADSTQGVAHSAGAVVRHGVSGRDFRESENHIAARGYDIDQTILDAANQTHVHGIATGDGVIVGTLKAQTLTQKTLTTPTINGATISGAVTSSATVTGGTFTSVTVTSSTISTSTLTGSFTASSATFVSPTISGSPVITGLSSAGMVDSSATPKIYVDSILGSATSAAISAASAAASATAAATSATSAAASASAAASSASASATSASAAATSATSAAASATAAATSATSAAASATAAATSATSAAASATASANSATASASSATAAATSATSAASSASAAATSASSAATSATSAATSATSAAASAASAAAVLTGAFDAKGDLLVGTGTNTFDQLTVAATNGYVLSVNSATATGLEWAAANPGDITGVTAGTGLSGGGTSGAVTVSLDTSSVYVVPTQTGQTGKYLTTDGSAASWATVDSLPSQTGNAGEFLTTDGTNASWAVVAGSLAQPTEPTSPTDGQIWVDTDGTALINQLLRWSKAPANGTTTLSGNDDNSVPLTYSVGYEQVFQNGALLARGGDYTATNGTSISLTNASVTGDIFEVFAAQPVAISDVYTQTQANAAFINDSLLTTTGDTIYASGANTPARLGIGTTGQVLSVSGGVPAWATPSSAMTFISRTSFSNVASTTIDSLFSSSYYNYVVVIDSIYAATTADDLLMQVRYGSTTLTTGVYQGNLLSTSRGSTTITNTNQSDTNQFTLGLASGSDTYRNTYAINFHRVGNTTEPPQWSGTGTSGPNDYGAFFFGGSAHANQIITGILLKSSSSNITGAVSVYGLAKA